MLLMTGTVFGEGVDTATAAAPMTAQPREAYRPSEERLDWARRVLAAAKSERGVFAFEGQMVDSPVLKHAEMMLRRAGESASG